jgi:hypothetical protein
MFCQEGSSSADRIGLGRVRVVKKMFQRLRNARLRNPRGIAGELMIAFLVALLNLMVLLITWKSQGIQADESIYIYGALEMMKGKLIYRDFWVFYPPGIFLLVWWAFALLGKSLFSLRLLLIIWASATTAFLYSFGRTFMPRFYAIASCFLFIAVGVNLWPVFGHHWTSTFAVVAAALCMAYYLSEEKIIFLALSGLFTGAVLLLQMHKGIPLLVGSLFILAIKAYSARRPEGSFQRGILKPSILYSVSSLLLLMATIVFLASSGLLKEAWAAAILFPSKELAGIANPNYSAPYGAYSIDLLNRSTELLQTPIVSAFFVRIVYFLLTFVAPLSAILVPVILLISKTPIRTKEFTHPMLASIAALSCLAASLGRPDFHHLLTALPPALVTTSYCVFFLSFFKRNFRRLRSAVIGVLLLSAGWIGLGTIVFALNSEVVNLNSALGFLAFPSKHGQTRLSLSPIEKLLVYIRQNTDDGEKIFIMPSSPFLYYLSGRENATRFPMLMSSLNSETQMIEVVEELEEEAPRFVILDPLASWEQYQAALPYARKEDFQKNYLMQYIERTYTRKENYGGFIILERSDEKNVR